MPLARLLTLSLMAVFLFAACGKSKLEPAATLAPVSAPAKPAPVPVYVIPAENLSDAQEKAKFAQVECAEESCSPSVGLLSFSTGENAGQCTASLLDETTVVTNSHCIPDDLKKTGSSCHNRLWLTFVPDASHPEFENQLECDQVLFASKLWNDGTDPDYAYLKMKKPSARPALSLSREGYLDQQEYYLKKVDPVRVPEKIRGKLGSVTCRAVYRSHLLPSFFYPSSPVALLADCPVINGNSGGPVLASDGSMRGVIFAAFKIPVVEAMYKRKRGYSLQESLVSLNLSTNLACSPELFLPGVTPVDCSLSSLMEKAEENRADSLRTEARRQAFAEKMRAETNPIFQDFHWSPEFDRLFTTTPNAMPYPNCVKPAALKRYLDRATPFSRPWFPLVEKVDRYGRLQSTLGNNEAKKYTLTVSKKPEGKFIAVMKEVGSYEYALGSSYEYALDSCPL